jgi:hypothetical protein
LEIAGTGLLGVCDDTTEPARFLEMPQTELDGDREEQYVVRENEEERATEIAEEFYPDVTDLPDETGTPEAGAEEETYEAERCARVARTSTWQRKRLPDAKYFREADDSRFISH